MSNFTEEQILDFLKDNGITCIRSRTSHRLHLVNGRWNSWSYKTWCGFYLYPYVLQVDLKYWIGVLKHCHCKNCEKRLSILLNKHIDKPMSDSDNEGRWL